MFFMIVSKNAVCVMIMDGTPIFISYTLKNNINLSVSTRHYLSSPGHKFHRPLHHFTFSHNEAWNRRQCFQSHFSTTYFFFYIKSHIDFEIFVEKNKSNKGRSDNILKVYILL